VTMSDPYKIWLDSLKRGDEVAIVNLDGKHPRVVKVFDRPRGAIVVTFPRVKEGFRRKFDAVTGRMVGSIGSHATPRTLAPVTQAHRDEDERAMGIHTLVNYTGWHDLDLATVRAVLASLPVPANDSP
jgi:hypothetical protein